MKTENIANREIINTIVKNSNGTFFSVTFTKKNGTVRNMTCRTGVKKGLTGKGSTYGDEAKSKYITLYDVVNKGYRAVNRDTISRIRVMGFVYTVTQD